MSEATEISSTPITPRPGRVAPVPPPISCPPSQYHSPSLSKAPLLNSTDHIEAPPAPSKTPRTPKISTPRTSLTPRFITPLGSPVRKALRLTKLDPQDAWLPITESRNGNAYYAAFHTLCSGIGVQALLYSPWPSPYLAGLLGILVCDWLQDVGNNRFDCGIRMAALHPMGTCPSPRSRRNWDALQQIHPTLQRNFREDAGLIPNHVPIRWYMRSADHHRWLHLEAILPDPMCSHMHREAIDDGGMVLGLYIRRRPIISAAQLEFHSRRVADRSHHGNRVLYVDMGGVRGRGRLPGVSYDPVGANTDIATLFGVLNALGIIAFAFRGHNLILEIQATMPSSEKHPSHVPMWR
ncbi:hypothetical protein L1049_023409 [Liquidambar formosana]|uniref:Amino acid transporter transmembrane domain-containing protein n=1 Tax=Liquidambar formosana TaxID=63359 RepID=A0AAP0RZZ4_LIQFO